MHTTSPKIAIIGLGYVGLPLARLFATKFPVIGFDINTARVAELRGGHDSTLEVEDEVLQSVLVERGEWKEKSGEWKVERASHAEPVDDRHAEPVEANHAEPVEDRHAELVGDHHVETVGDRHAELVEAHHAEPVGDRHAELVEARHAEPVEAHHAAPVDDRHAELVEAHHDEPVSGTGLFCSTNLEDIKDCNYYIITVPTPIDKNNRPDLTPLYKSSETVGNVLKSGDIVIYESTVYPGVTEEECVPVLEKTSGLIYNHDFFVGYSPERINRGDKEHTVEKILKVTAGSTPEVGQKVNALYKSVITAGTHLAPTIKVAEAAKVIENSQRDINIAFVNELAKIFNKLDIDTHDVLEAAGTKWNFLPFKPGLVGGHCIGVDPYYLAQKAQELGYHPEIILAGRRMNDSMGQYVASEVIKLMLKNDLKVKGANILVLGITFKKNCPDVRNTKAVDVVKELQQYGTDITIYDPLANPAEVEHEYGLITLNSLPAKKFDAVVLAVAHKEFLELKMSSLKNDDAVVYDVKGILGDKADNKL